MMTTTTEALTFDEFAARYRAAYAATFKYTPAMVGHALMIERMAALADAYPEWAEVVEAEG